MKQAILMKQLKKIVVVILIAGFTYLVHYLNANYQTPILMYHAIDGQRVKDYAAVSSQAFTKQMQFIKKGKYRVISLSDYCTLLKNNRPISRKLVVITFDDGLKDNLVAVKILRELDFPATIFMIVNNIDKDGYLSNQDIMWILANSRVQISSHTVNHHYLPSTRDGQLKSEIILSKEKLQERYLIPVETIAYPLGGFDERTLNDVELAGYLCGCATNRGFSRKLNRFALRRIKISARDSNFTLWVKLSGFYNVFRKLKKPY